MRASIISIALIICLSIIISTVSAASFTVYYDSGCSVPVKSITTATGIQAPTCVNNAAAHNSTFGECDNTNGDTTLQFKGYSSDLNCPSTVTPDSSIYSTGPTSGCNPVVITGSGSTYNFYLQGSCTNGLSSTVPINTQFNSLLSTIKRKFKRKLMPQ